MPCSAVSDRVFAKLQRARQHRRSLACPAIAPEDKFMVAPCVAWKGTHVHRTVGEINLYKLREVLFTIV